MSLKKRILLVEDDVAMKQLLSLILEHVNYEIVRAGNGREGLKMLEANPNHIDLILSDIMMDEMDGFEFISAVKANINWKSIPFVFLTGKVDAHSRIAGLRLGADDYLIKPFNREEVVIKIQSLLEKAKNVKRFTITGLNGNLSLMTMKEISQIISITKRTGLLVLVSKHIGGALYFKNGLIINASSEENFAGTWGEIWGEESAQKLVCLTEGDFRFEPRNVDDIPVAVTHSIDSLLEQCHRPVFSQQKIEERIHEAFINIEPAVQTPTPPPPPPPPPPSPAPVEVVRPPETIDSVLLKLKQYEDKYDLFAIHIGLIGSRGHVKELLGALLVAASVAPEKVVFDSGNILSAIANFTLLKVKIKDRIIYFHVVFDDMGDEKLWPNMLLPSVGIIVLKDMSNNRYLDSLEAFSYRYRMHCIMHNTLDANKPLELNRVLTLIGGVVTQYATR